MKAVAPHPEEIVDERTQKPFSKRAAATHLVIFSLLFTGWLVIQLQK